tara:strand:+ start:21 stop:401 length:381 start_codon:yes stop_codon:yes gene_type:complete
MTQIQDAIDKDVADGKLIPITDAAQHRIDAKDKGTYDVYIEIDIDCEELVDACGIDYTRSVEDNTQNEICLSLTPDEFKDTFEHVNITDNYWNEVSITEILLNPEMCEYVTKVTIYKPNGDIVCFY